MDKHKAIEELCSHICNNMDDGIRRVHENSMVSSNDEIIILIPFYLKEYLKGYLLNYYQLGGIGAPVNNKDEYRGIKLLDGFEKDKVMVYGIHYPVYGIEPHIYALNIEFTTA